MRRSPARVGLLNETMRRRKGVKRSPDADLSVIALGPQADAVVGTGLTGKDPTGPDSPFQKILDLGGALAGLGVSFNYMNMIHVLDSRYRRTIRSKYILDQCIRPIRSMRSDAATPSSSTPCSMTFRSTSSRARVVHALKPDRDTFRSLRIGDTDFFVWELPSWENLCVEHIEQMLDAGSFPCWLADVEPRVARSLNTAAEGY